MNLKRYKEFFIALWQFLVKYHEPREEDQYWQNVIFDAENLEKKFSDIKFTSEACAAIINKFGKVLKEGGTANEHRT